MPLGLNEIYPKYYQDPVILILLVENGLNTTNIIVKSWNFIII